MTGRLCITKGCPAERPNKDFTETRTFMEAYTWQAVCPGWKLSPSRVKKHIVIIHRKVLGRLASGGFGHKCQPPSNNTNLTTTFLIKVLVVLHCLKDKIKVRWYPRPFTLSDLLFPLHHRVLPHPDPFPVTFQTWTESRTRHILLCLSTCQERSLPSPARLGELLLTHDTHIRSPLLAVNHPPSFHPSQCELRPLSPPVSCSSPAKPLSPPVSCSSGSKTTVHRTGCFLYLSL